MTERKTEDSDAETIEHSATNGEFLSCSSKEVSSLNSGSNSQLLTAVEAITRILKMPVVLAILDSFLQC
jgi:hypothetical protein